MTGTSRLLVSPEQSRDLVSTCQRLKHVVSREEKLCDGDGKAGVLLAFPK